MNMRPRPKHEIGQVLRENWKKVQKSTQLNHHQKRMLKALSICRTAALGGHLDGCDSCGHERISYNSCRNRHCPKCQGVQRERWIMAREAELLPTSYFHVVFTLPAALNGLALKYPRLIYGLLFQTAWQTIQAFASDPKHLGAKPAMTAILHTWGQNLSLHPHLHCIVPGGGITPQGKWKSARLKGKFLFPVKAMSKVFRAKFVAALRKAATKENILIDPSIFKQLFAKNWVIYAKRPFLGPNQVIEYLGRYTHKIAISNHRLLKVDDTHIRFGYKDYRQAGKKKELVLPIMEFIRRFALHILPPSFVRIRHYGFLASRYKQQNLRTIREDLGLKPQAEVVNGNWQAISRQRLEFDPMRCPCCGKMAMRVRFTFPPLRAPPIKNAQHEGRPNLD